MKKIAIFTEGLTEQLFVCSAIRYLAGKRSLHIKRQKLLGGKKFPTILMNVGADDGNGDDCDLSFLMIDCANDERVVSAINDNYEHLIDQGYHVIFGVRDLRPSFTLDQLERLLEGSLRALPKGPVTPGLVIAVMEAEAWFIAEHSHFVRMDSSLTLEHIRAQLNIDVDVVSDEFSHPAKVLSEIYELAGLNYGKSQDDINRTIEAIDLSEFRTGSVFDRSRSARVLFEHLEASMELASLVNEAAQLSDSEVASD
ncbi:hypothetical protein [Agrobacterium leguminum]|jgi:hypothetical protein|uniref:hypothetical protein n=1 Tax=Agrobacterium leguminum TaxID=2792015 RepID=UPI003CE4C033